MRTDVASLLSSETYMTKEVGLWGIQIIARRSGRVVGVISVKGKAVSMDGLHCGRAREYVRNTLTMRWIDCA